MHQRVAHGSVVLGSQEHDVLGNAMLFAQLPDAFELGAVADDAPRKLGAVTLQLGERFRHQVQALLFDDPRGADDHAAAWRLAAFLPVVEVDAEVDDRDARLWDLGMQLAQALLAELRDDPEERRPGQFLRQQLVRVGELEVNIRRNRERHIEQVRRAHDDVGGPRRGVDMDVPRLHWPQQVGQLQRVAGVTRIA